ncbi:MAG: hypothetical protein KIH65_005255 [Candidatus Uhrbacteria bacterium]|nr:hypothetical protein [Candidatus Uhrbacteria bacterium]
MSKKTALLSVYSKQGIVEFAQGLIELGDWEIISSGGTYKTLTKAGVPAKDVAEITGLGPILGHRVVTLHPAIHGGLLATPEMKPELDALGYPWIDLVCVDLYPIREAIEKPGATIESVLEQTDIGGPTMLRSAAKGGRIAICQANQREGILEWIRKGYPQREAVIQLLRGEVERVIAEYCQLSAAFHVDRTELEAIADLVP